MHGNGELLRHRPEPVLRLGNRELALRRERLRRGPDRLDEEHDLRLPDHRQRPGGDSLYGSAGNTFSNNLFKNEKNAVFIRGGTPANAWNVPRRAGTNIVGGPAIGGNCWLAPDGTGLSETNPQSDGFITKPYTLEPGNVDNLPLAAQPGNKAPAANTTPRCR